VILFFIIANLDSSQWICSSTPSAFTERNSLRVTWIPYFALTGEQPKLDKFLPPFGTKVYTKIQTNQNKLLPKSRPGRYMGHADTTSSYRIYVPDTNLVTCTRDVAFVDETSTIKVHEGPILDFSNLPSSQPTVLQQPPTPVPPDDVGLRSSEADQWKKATDDYNAIVHNNTYR